MLGSGVLQLPVPPVTFLHRDQRAETRMTPQLYQPACSPREQLCVSIEAPHVPHTLFLTCTDDLFSAKPPTLLDEVTRARVNPAPERRAEICDNCESAIRRVNLSARECERRQSRDSNAYLHHRAVCRVCKLLQRI